MIFPLIFKGKKIMPKIKNSQVYLKNFCRKKKNKEKNFFCLRDLNKNKHKKKFN
jgi:hypothetical protein